MKLKFGVLDLFNVEMVIVPGCVFFGAGVIYFLSSGYFLKLTRLLLFLVNSFIFFVFFQKNNSPASLSSCELREFLILLEWIIFERVWWWYTNLNCFANVCCHSMKIVPLFPHSFIPLRSYIPFWNEAYSKLLAVISPQWKRSIFKLVQKPERLHKNWHRIWS